MWYGTIYNSTGSSELTDKVVILKDMLLCIGLFDTDETVTAMKCICSEW